MKLATLYRPDGGTVLCIAAESGYVPVSAFGRPALEGLADVGDLLRRGSSAVAELRSLADQAAPAISAPDARLAPPVLRPGKILCVGLNYAAHIAEAGSARPEHIVLFAKFPTCLVGDGEQVVLPGVTTQLDYEGELAVVIGPTARAVSPADALNHVAGYTIMNDISARDLQFAEPQWIRGKALDTFAPTGPVFLDAAAAPPVGQMRIRTRVNGELRQDASCMLMITPVPELISYISQHITLEPGDLIATGTPAGVALGMEHPVYLAPGDKVEVEIPAIGTLTSVIAAPRRLI